MGQRGVRNGQCDRADCETAFRATSGTEPRTVRYWYGFLMNEGAGPDARAHYKGWPISKDEWDEIFG